jgi:sugar diacid utilization regulator
VGKTLEDILDISDCKSLKIVAGRKGLKRHVRWISAIEVIEIIKFSNEGDLNFITGLAIASEDEFLSIVVEADHYKMAGMIVALGPYIKKIPKSVLNYCNSHDFPIIIMPWDVKISTVSHAIGDFISDEANQYKIPLELLKSLLLGKEDPHLTPETIVQLKRLGIFESGQFNVLLLQIVKKSESLDARLKEICDQLIKAMRSIYSSEGIIVKVESGIAIVLRGKEGKINPNEKELDEIRNLAVKTQLLFDDCNIRIGIGNQYNTIEKINDSYNEALLVTKILSASSQHRAETYRFDQLGPYKVVWDCRNSSELLKFSEEILGKLISYDKINKTDIINFLRAYYDFNGNVMDISKNLFLHKNTVIYKIRKIEGILGCSFAQQDTVFNLKLALMIQDVIFQTDGCTN